MRLPGLDLLRGIRALLVAVYHVLYWQDEAKLYAWGTYGVYIFFVLSGASMVVGYAGRLSTNRSLAAFLALRLTRLLPLYALTLVAGLLLQVYRQASLHELPLGSVFLNIFFLFGVGNPGAVSRVVGGWSLGIEFAFYFMFPMILALTLSRAWLVVLAVSFLTQHTFVHYIFGNGRGLVENWVMYTQFLSFIFYFFVGCAIGRLILMGKLEANRLAPIWLAIALFIILVGSQADAVQTLTGLVGLGLSLTAAASVVAATQVDLRGNWKNIAETLGRSSYGVYILHPPFYLLFDKLARGKWIDAGLVLSLTLVGSFMLALVLERWFERPIQDFAKKRLAGQFSKREAFEIRSAITRT